VAIKKTCVPAMLFLWLPKRQETQISRVSKLNSKKTFQKPGMMYIGLNNCNSNGGKAVINTKTINKKVNCLSFNF